MKFTTKMHGLLSLVAALTAFAVSDAAAQLSDSYYAPIGVRSYGMGETGTADAADVANVSYNPAIIAVQRGLRATGQYHHQDYSPVHVDQRYAGGIAGFGRRRSLGDSWSAGGGVGVGYVRLEDEISIPVYLPEGSVVDTEDRTIVTSIGALVDYRDAVRLGFGLNAKFRKVWWNTKAGTYDDVDSETFFDYGLYAAVKVLDKNDYIVEATAGWAYINSYSRDEPTDDTAHVTYPPEYRRYALGVRFTSPSLATVDERFDASLPLVALALNWDVEDPVKESSREDRSPQMVGLELAVLQMLFVRVGYVDDRTRVWLYQEPTWGLGAGIVYKRLSGRFDYSSNPDIYPDGVEIQRFGLSVGYTM